MRYIARRMFSVSSARGATLALFCAVISASTAWGAAVPRPLTPHEQLDRALTPVQQALDELHVTAEERASVSDLLQRGEALAAERVESYRRGEPDRGAAADRSIAILARVVRGRIEAARAERAASEREQRATETEASARQARGALERAAERRIVVERDTERAQQQAQQLQQQAQQPTPQPQPTPTHSRPPAATRPATARPTPATTRGGAR